ncbi:MAG: ATP-binding protein [Candidatus Aminicenantes bacterium]|jgi:anti-sigma regulatory factor (Ser/Thr protein kinase)
MEKAVFESDLSETKKVRNFLRKSLLDLKLSEEVHFAIELSVLEIFTNIVRYAYPKNKDRIFLKTWQEEDEVYVEIKDNGIPFDPSQEPEPDIEKIIETKEIGGFGILLSRKFMDGFEYRRENDQNVLTMHKKIFS